MDWGHYLFSFAGRVNRAKYWLFTGFMIVYVAIYLSIAAVTLLAMLGGNASAASGVILIILSFGMLVLLWPAFAISVKRLHDRNKTGWWIVLFGILPGAFFWFADVTMPSAAQFSTIGIVALLFGFGISIWAFVELGCLRGTEGENSFGQDPIAKEYEHRYE